MDDLLDGNSSLTPTIAGIAVTMITGTLLSLFDMNPKWCVLILSMLFGLVSFRSQGLSIAKRSILYLTNTITIMVFSVGLNQAGMAASGYDACKATRPSIVTRGAPKKQPETTAFFKPWL